jgi:hypothetical protein
MQQYRLLRNNKESGPYTWKELAHLPLKPYDLVWVDGKSAAWRYPSELPEFKEVAPKVEEDFYESFHRKPSEKKEVAPIIPAVFTEKLATPATEQRKKVAVILPEQTRPPKQEPVLRVVKKEAAPVEIAAIHEPVATGSVPGPEIDQLQVPPPKLPIRNISRQLIYRVAGFVGAIALIWLFWQFGTGTKSASQNTETVSAALPILQTSGAISESNELPPALPANPGLEFAALKRHLVVRPEQINVGMFGGINKLQLTIENRHSEAIESISIAVDFLEKDQSLHHTEIVEVKKIEAASELLVNVPANGKGRAVQTRIIAIGKYKF